MTGINEIDVQLNEVFGAFKDNNSHVECARQFASVIQNTSDWKILTSVFDKIKKALSGKTQELRKGACLVIAEMSKFGGPKVEAYLIEMMPIILDKYADKKMIVRPAAAAAAEAICANSNSHALRQLLPSFFGAMKIEKKWQTKEAALKLIKSYVATAPEQVSACLPEIIPHAAHTMYDTRKEVQRAATECLSAICIGNQDIEPFIPSLIEAMGDPSLVPECVYKLAATTFVKTVDSPTLAIMEPLLVRGLSTNTISVKRQCAVIIDNMCKLVDDPREAQLFLPKLLPGLKKAIDEVADPECREVATRAHATLLHAGGEDGEKPYIVALETVIEMMDQSLKKGLSGGINDNVVKNYVAKLCHDLIMANNFDKQLWTSCISPYYTPLTKNADQLSNIMREISSKEAKKFENLGDDDDDEGVDLCNTEFSLAYGGMILLNNTKLKLKKGHHYGLCGPNGCGKSTLMRAIANGQLEGFPSKDELKTVFVEHNLQASEAELDIVSFVLHDEELSGIDRAVVVKTLEGVGFDDEMRAKAVSSLSGGWKMKLELARAMLMNADILLLDEPTNHLDVDNVKWLEDYLNGLKDVTSMIVSHDSGFLDNVCTNIIHYEHRKLKIYKGNLSKFVEQKPEAKAYYQLEDPNFAFKFPTPGFLDNIKSKGKRILKMENCTYTYPGSDKPSIQNVTVACALSSRVAVIGPNGAGKSTMIKMLTGEVEPQSGEVTKHPNLRFAYVAQHAFHHIEEHLDKTPNQYVQWRFQNGTDKELLAKATRQMTKEEKEQMKKPVNWDGLKRTVEGIRARRKMKKTFEYEVEWVGMSADENSWIPRDKLERWGFEKLLQATDDAEAARANLLARPVTTGVIQKFFEDFGLPSEFSTHSRIRGLSGGQKVKVVLGAAMWQNPHILVLDEPTNYLDRDSLGALAKAIQDYEGGVIMISHSREFTDALGKEVWNVRAGRLCIEGEVTVDNDTTKLEQKLEETSIDAFGNVVKNKIKRKLTRKERKQREKAKKAALAAGEDWSSSDEE